MLPHPPPETNAQGYLLSFDKDLLQLENIHGFLTESYWSKAIPKSIVAQAIEHSMCVGIYHEGQQIAFARLITDYTTFAYVCDVFVLEQHRGQGLSKWMMKSIMAHPALLRLRRWMLATADAHELYSQFGFTPLTKPEMFMQVHRPEVYKDLPQ
ncbi:GNAT family N-acetyltransferase [Rufibacter roseus]|uniref:GNAT family N-acetyltransferase n=1 Tax=Rufibacter roseus TaxID=1567108 RepID=A0ABW2DG52_9BACT|nr:GNAT family N-acetyltransferase [Rufibacter roseus]